jgi:hypothetical protein
MADQMKRESLRTENEEDKSLRPMSLFKVQAQTQMNCQNSIFGFTKILWLLHPEKAVADMIRDKDGKEMMFKYLQTTSLLYQIHFEFICQFYLLSITEVSVKERAQRRSDFIIIVIITLIILIAIIFGISITCYRYCHFQYHRCYECIAHSAVDISPSLMRSYSVSLTLHHTHTKYLTYLAQHTHSNTQRAERGIG